jgi:hypothetical protein
MQFAVILSVNSVSCVRNESKEGREEAERVVAKLAGTY